MGYFFNGKRAFVTGSSRGIGREIVRQLIKYGAEVFALSKTENNLNALKTENPSVHTICVDIADWKKTREAIKETGIIDLLVNNVGIPGTIKPFDDVTEEELDEIYSINLKPIINISQVVIKNLIEQQKSGAIVNISSLASMKHFGVYAYSSNKAAMDRLTKSMAVEFGPYNIRINSVNPSVVLNGKTHRVLNSPEMVNKFKEIIPLRKFCTEEDIANAVIFLLSDKAKMISGVILPVDGAQSAV